MSEIFGPGDSVRVIATHPPGHRRTPYYIRGKVGEIERVCGKFPNPEELADGFDGLPKKTLYRVRFKQTDVWENYSGPDADTVDVDIYEHWLLPVKV